MTDGDGSEAAIANSVHQYGLIGYDRLLRRGM